MKKNIIQPFEQIPCFSRQNLALYFQGSNSALNERIKRNLKNRQLLKLKNGLYTTTMYYRIEQKKTEFKEFIASRLRFPSYLSLEYVLSKYSLLTEATYPVTSITMKTNRSYQNILGSYAYSHVKSLLYGNFEEVSFYNNSYFIAGKAKALFDYLYLKRNLSDPVYEILEGLRINWDNFSREDFQLFVGYVLDSNSKKMLKLMQIIKKNIFRL